MMDENEITQRLRDAGDQQVPGEMRAGHLTRMHAATSVVDRPKRFGRLAVAAAAFAGFAVGSTGFAMAGALPDPAQQVAHDVLAVVQIDVENPKNRGQCISNAARTIEDEAEKADAKQRCKDEIQPGRPGHAGQGRPEGVGRPDGLPSDADPCKGRPPFAGKMDPAEKQRLREQWANDCQRGLDDEGEIEELEVEEPESEEPEIEEREIETEAETETIEPAEPPEPPLAPADPQEQAPEGTPFGGAEEEGEGTTPPGGSEGTEG